MATISQQDHAQPVLNSSSESTPTPQSSVDSLGIGSENSHDYITAPGSPRSSWLRHNSNLSLDTYRSVEDPANIPIDNIEDFRRVFRDITVTDALILDSSLREAGGQADVVHGVLTMSPGATVQVAVKIQRPSSHAIESDILRRLAREIAIWRSLAHPNVLELRGIYWTDGLLPAILSPWCQNGDAVKYIKARSQEDNIDWIRINLLSGALKGLIYLHDLAICHGDVKGMNILVADDGTARLGDFGVTAVLLDSRTATSFGTYRWMAPDLHKPHAHPTPYSDMWSFGCVVLELMSLKIPYFDFKSDLAVIKAVADGGAPTRPSGISDELWDATKECFSPTPRQRPSGLAFLSKLEAARASPLHNYILEHVEVWSFDRGRGNQSPMFRVYARFIPAWDSQDPLADSHHLRLFRTYDEFLTFSLVIGDPVRSLYYYSADTTGTRNRDEVADSPALAASGWSQCLVLDRFSEDLVREARVGNLPNLFHETIRTFFVPRHRGDKWICPHRFKEPEAETRAPLPRIKIKIIVQGTDTIVSFHCPGSETYETLHKTIQRKLESELRFPIGTICRRDERDGILKKLEKDKTVFSGWLNSRDKHTLYAYTSHQSS